MEHKHLMEVPDDADAGGSNVVSIIGADGIVDGCCCGKSVLAELDEVLLFSTAAMVF